MTRVLDIRDLHVKFSTPGGSIHAVKGVNCHVDAGECLGIVGESGSGKSQTFRAAVGLLGHNGIAEGEIKFLGQDMFNLTPAQLNKIRGNDVAMIFQDPLTSLTPGMRVCDQMKEVLQVHKGIRGGEADRICLDWLERVRINDAKRRLQQYPFELSGGMRQRIMIALAMLCNPSLLIADEPTTALDVTIQAEILDIMAELRRSNNTSIVLITHDMGVVARMCDRVQVMYRGNYVEEGSVKDIFANPTQEYTRMLLDSMPKLDQPRSLEPLIDIAGERPLLETKDIRVSFDLPGNLFSRHNSFNAVDGISFKLRRGETLGVVGESGSGKSTLARAILKLVPTSDGVVSWLGTNMSSFDKGEIRKLRENLQVIFQDPLASLNPSMTIGDAIAEPLKIFKPDMSKSDRQDKVKATLQRVGLTANFADRYPHELSGGQNQRVGIARAIIAKPKLVICDEAVSALDVSVQAQVLRLLRGLQEEFGLSFIFISHDLSVVRDVSHRTLVMYLGRVVEMADTDDLFNNPTHPYTKQLISAVPIPDPEVESRRQRIRLQGELTSPSDPTAHLRFLPSKIQQNQLDYKPRLVEISPNHMVAQHDSIESLMRD
ncbi:MAG: ABC transporter ATP-binding protein [Paracoccaceae bacterium]